MQNFSYYRHEADVGDFAVTSLLSSLKAPRILAAVLTLKQSISLSWGVEWLTRSEGEKLASLAIRRFTKALFKNRVRRFGNYPKLPVLTSFEGETSGKRLHLNFAIGIPDWLCEERAAETFLAESRRLRWVRNIGFARLISDPDEVRKWASYIVKEPDAVLLGESYFPQ